MYHILYRVTNVLNEKYYIGIHSTKNLKDGYKGSGKIILSSLKKHGKENHKFEILKFCDNRNDLIESEKQVVNDKLLKDKKCMNLQLGGISGFDFIKLKRQADPAFDKKWKKMQSEKLKKVHKAGKINYNTFEGKSHSDETKLKMSKAKKGLGLKESNSQFGTCWITKQNENKKIKKEELESYLTKGWTKGRV